MNASLDPYAVNYKGQKINTFNIVKEGGFRIARLTNASASFSYSFSGEGKSKLGADYSDPNIKGGSYNQQNGTSSGSSSGESYQYEALELPLPARPLVLSDLVRS